MLIITTTPLNFKAKKVIRIFHPKDEKNSTVTTEAQHINGSTTLVRIGQTIVDDNIVNNTDVIVLHSCNETLLKDYLRRLQSWKDKLTTFKDSNSKYLVVYGNTMSIIADKIFNVPKDDNVIINQMQKSPTIDVTTEGLGLTKFWYTSIINIKQLGNNLKRNLKYLSKSRRIFLLESGTVIDNTGKVTYGNLYQMLDGELITVKELPKPETDDDVESIHDRKIHPIRAIYAEEETVSETPDNTEIQ